MKKTLLLLSIALLTGMAVSAQITDTIVSLTPSNRNALIEEYTGIGCQYCPDGHRIANEIMAAHPGRVCVINIHEGGYAYDTYTTQFGTALASQIGLSGYPAGTVNRHVFSQYSNVTDVYRDYWPNCVNTILNTASPVNIAADGIYDWLTNTVTIRVQLYYTGTQSINSNLLNVAILQDSVMGSQSGSSYNPSQVVNGQYRHMHMLRHLITGQWGEAINTITPGTLVEKVYTYHIPSAMGTPNPITAVPKDLRFVAFLTEGHQEVITACEVEVTNIAPETLATVAAVTPISNTRCDDEIMGSLTLANYGRTTVTSATVEYGIDGTVEGTIDWEGSLAPNENVVLELPTLHINTGVNVEISAKVTSVNGSPFAGGENVTTVVKQLYSAGGIMRFILYTDAFGRETRFKFYDPNNIIVLKDGPFQNMTYIGTTEHLYWFAPYTTGCFRLEVTDTQGDGINSGYGEGYFELRDADDNVIFHNDGKFGAKAVYMIDVTAPAGVEEYSADAAIYPNPATDVITINTSDNVQRVELLNMQGQLVKVVTGDVKSLSVKSLANGLYTLKLTTDNGTSMHKIIKK